MIKNPPVKAGDLREADSIPKDLLKEGMATHSNILAWRIPWTEKPGGLHSPWGLKELDLTEVT